MVTHSQLLKKISYLLKKVAVLKDVCNWSTILFFFFIAASSPQSSDILEVTSYEKRLGVPEGSFDKQEEESKVESLSEESGIRGRNELADIREEPVYSRPTFPSGTSNLNFSHQNEASSSSGSSTRWDHPTCPAPVVTNRIHRFVQRVILRSLLAAPTRSSEIDDGHRRFENSSCPGDLRQCSRLPYLAVRKQKVWLNEWRSPWFKQMSNYLGVLMQFLLPMQLVFEYSLHLLLKFVDWTRLV